VSSIITNRSRSPTNTDWTRIARSLTAGRRSCGCCFYNAPLDRRDGLNSAGFVSGYRGSPLGGFDAELSKVQETLQANDILFQPGLNEDLALTAVA